MKKLNEEALKQISGGTWDYTSVSDEERAEMDAIFEVIDDTNKEAWKLWDEFVVRMNAKYGSNRP